MSVKSFPLEHVVKVDEVPDEGLSVSIAASQDECRGLAVYLDVNGVQSADADLVVTRWRGQGLAVRGTVGASVTQTCVVTLEPVDNRIREEIESFFAPDIAPRQAEEALDADPVSEMDIEPLIDGRIDLGALVCEHLALGLDPYPRKGGAVFQLEGGNGGEEDQTGAFAALAALRADRDKT